MSGDDRQVIPERENLLLYRTAGGSMFPFIRWREHLLVKKTAPAALQPDDIIVFKEKGGRPVCHRIARIETREGKRWFHTKGDRNRDEDAPVREEIIIGKVVAIHRKDRLVTCSSPEWSAAAGAPLPLLAGGLFHIKNFVKNGVASLPCRLFKGNRPGP